MAAVAATVQVQSLGTVCVQGSSSRLLGGKPLCLAPLPSNSTRGVSLVVRAGSGLPSPTKVLGMSVGGMSCGGEIGLLQDSNRALIFASKQSLSYLDGSLPGDYGFDPLGLSDPDGAGGFIEPSWLSYAEIINGRYAMLGAAGAIAPEILGKLGLIPQETALPWFKTGVIPPAGTYDYWADPFTLFVFEIALMGFAEHRRAQDYYKPGSMGKQYFLGFEKFLGGSGNPAYPGGPIFNPLGFGKNESELKDLKIKEVKNGRLAMLAILGYFIQAIFTGVGPFQNLLDHLADPVHNNVLTNFKFPYLY